MTEQTFEEAMREAGLETCDDLQPMSQRSRILAAVASGIGSMLVTKVVVASGEPSRSGVENAAALFNGAVAGGCAYFASGEIETTSDTGAAVLVSGVAIGTVAVSSIAGKAIGMLLR